MELKLLITNVTTESTVASNTTVDYCTKYPFFCQPLKQLAWTRITIGTYVHTGTYPYDYATVCIDYNLDN